MMPLPQFPLDEKLIESEIGDALIKAVETLEPRQREVIERRFGLSGKPETLKEVGKTLARADQSHSFAGKPLSRDRIRQIEEKALRRLRRPAVTRGILQAGYVPPRKRRDLYNYEWDVDDTPPPSSPQTRLTISMASACFPSVDGIKRQLEDWEEKLVNAELARLRQEGRI